MNARAEKSAAVVVPQKLGLGRRLAVWVVLYGMRLVMRSWRLRWKNAANCEGFRGPVIYCIWHNRLAQALAFHYYDEFVRLKWPAAGSCAVISASKDGTFLASLVKKLNIVPIRGSSSRRGAQALLEATTWIEKDYNVGITPDGPRGPVYKVQQGIIDLARVTGRPIIPMSSYVSAKISFRSWDRFQVPLPFALCELRYGKPLWIPREATDEEREQYCRDLEKTMMDLTSD